jgi:signal peptidase I
MTTTNSTDPTARKRNPLIALALGLAAPGLGLLYAGNAVLAALVLVTVLLAAVGVPALFLVLHLDLVTLTDVLRALLPALWVPPALFAVWLAAKSEPRVLQGFQHPWWYLGFALVAWTGQGALRELVVARYLITAPAMPSSSMLPTLARNDTVLVKRLGFDAHTVVPGDVVIVRAEKAEDPAFIARVVALAGHVVVVRDGALVIDDVEVARPPCGPTDHPHTDEDGQVVPCHTETLNGRSWLTMGTTHRAPVTSVPSGFVYVVGDNRSASQDAQRWGVVSLERIEGRASDVVASPAGRAFLGKLR